MTFLNPVALAGFALFIPVILLYMLRLRRREVVVSSTFLWQQVVRDREANTPWQRLRRNLLLFLQLLIIALLVLALARPAVLTPSISAGRTAILLDASASMNASDGRPGTRFEAAVRVARDLIGTANADNEFSIIRAGTAAEVLTPFTADRQALAAALDAAGAGQGGADWETAFTLAAGTQGADSYSTVIYSDGGGELSNAPGLPGEVRYEPVGASDRNLAITALAVRALPGQSPQLYAQVENFSGVDADVIFDLRVDGELLDAQRLTVPASSVLPVVSNRLPAGFEAVRAGLTAPADAGNWPDDLALDDAAYTVANDAHTRRILLISPGGNRFLEQALGSLPGVQTVTSRPEAGIPSAGFDLIVLDGWLPETLPDTDLLIVNPPNSSELFTVGRTLERPADGSPGPAGNIRSTGADPRLRFVDLSGVNLLRFRDVNAEWADELVVADGGPLLLAGDTGGRQVAILTFDVRESDLPLQIAFPVLMASLVNWYAPQDLVATPFSRAVGDAVAINPEPGADAIRITPPDGEPYTLALDTAGGAVVSGTDTPGLYTVETLEGDTVTQSAVFAVNLFDAAESDIAPRPGIQIGGETVLPEPGDAVGVRELWPLFALAALAILLIEWWIYFRRQRAPSRFKPISAPATPA
ncbi:MAG: VWA domain-containing protein [Anaerolineae bacterium]|nr:VWA domain-containing protein [Anaerolineae bacterium]